MSPYIITVTATHYRQHKCPCDEMFSLSNKIHQEVGRAKDLSAPQLICRGADKSLARPGRKQATPTEDFDFHISYL